MALSSNVNFNVQIDSEYRDISRYPTFTDFGIKFKNENTGVSLNGYPYSSNSYNLQTQIDPDFISSKFEILNGSLQHIQKDLNGNIYLSGTIDILTTGEQFQINNNNYRLFTLSTNTIPNVFICKFRSLNEDDFYLSWICYLLPDVSTTYRLSPTRSTMEIDDIQNIYWTFDGSFNKVNMFSSLNGILYTIEPENYDKQRQYEVICAFTNLGNQYSINGIPWGFHIISSNNDLTSTLENGRNYIKTNTSLDIFSTINTNPYDPYLYTRTGITQTSSSTIESSYLFMLNTGSIYYDEKPRYLYWRRISSSSIGFEYYKIVDNEYEYITTFDNTTISPWITMSTYWPLSYTQNDNYIYIVASQYNGNMWLLRFNLLTQVMDLHYNQPLGINPYTGIPPYIPTNSTMLSTLSNTNIYITLSNVVFGGSTTAGSLLYYLNANNPTGSGGAQLVFWDSTSQGSNFGRTIDIFSYNEYIIVGYQGNTVSSGDTIFRLYSYNTSSGSYISQNYTTIENYPINLINLASPTFFKDLNDNLCCCLTTIDRSIIFKILPTDLSILYNSQINNLTGNEAIVYGSKKVISFEGGNKLYLIGSGNGSIYDISNISYPYSLTTSSYPKINDGYTMYLSNVVNTPQKNYLGGIFFPLDRTLDSILFSCEFIDTSNTLISEHYTKPIIQYYPNTSISGYDDVYKEMFSIEGYEDNVSTNFSPSQFIGNGLIAWYNCRDQNNLIINSSGTVTGILDFSGNGLNLYAESGSSQCPTFYDGGVFWDCSVNQISSFSSSGSFEGNSIKFIIASYITPVLTAQPTYIIQCYSGTQINAELSLTGALMRYESGIEYTYLDTSFDTIISTKYNPVYFGYNTPENLQPYLAYQNSTILFSDRSLKGINTSINKISIMKGLNSSSYQASLYEVILLDFIPTQYQLSLFQSYFNSTVYIFPQIIPKLTGVFSLYTSTIGGLTNLYIKSIDGSTIPFNELSPILPPYSISTKYVQVKYIRRQNSSKPNYICTICDDNYVRVYRLDDFFNRSYSYSQYDLSSYFPLYSIEPYIDSSGIVKIIISTYDTNPTAGAGSPTLIHLTLTEGSDIYDTLTLSSTYTFPILSSYYPNINTFKVYTYDNGKTYLFTITSLNFRDGSSGRIIFPVFYVFDITNSSIFTQTYQFPNPPSYLPDEQVIDSAGSSRSSKIIKYSNNKIYFIYKKYFGGNNKIYDITDPSNINFLGQVKSGLTEYSGMVTVDRTLPEFIEPIDMYVNPLNNNIYLMDSFYFNGTGSISFYNYTDTKSVSAEYFIPQIFYNPENDITYNNSSFLITNIKTSVWNQKVWAMITFSNTSFNNIGTVFIDISNIEFVSQSYIDNEKSTIINSNSYTDIKGIGVGIIHKIKNNGSPNWVATIGGDGTSGNNKWASNINISNIDTDNTLTNAYIVGSWKYKIQTFVNSDENGNIISPYKLNSITTTPTDNNINSFICKINMNNGNFSWLIPTFGTNDDYNQRVKFNNSNSTFSIISYFSSPVMLIYQPQLSSTTSWSNPINTILNISNVSSFTSSLITFNTNGGIIWSAKIYSQEQSSNTKFYDLYIESGTISCIGITNANKLECIDSTLKNVQNTYTNLNPINQEAVVIYSFNNNGAYIQSQKNELPPGMKSSVFDINSYSTLNRTVYFINCFTTSNNGNIYFYNKDGSLGSIIDNYPINRNFSKIIQYKYDSSFTDTNGKKYSQLKTIQSLTGSLSNYKIFIQGGTVNNSVFETSNQTVLNTETILNSNYSIRSNTENTITLNSLIITSNIERYNLPNSSYWNSTISETPLFGMISIMTGNNIYRISQLFSSPPSTTSSTGLYYVIYPNSSNILETREISSIQEYRGLYTFTTTSPISNNPQFLYLTTINKNANYTLQFYPGSLNKDVYFNITLTSLTIPNRPVKSYDYPGVRYLNDFPYIYLVIVNMDDNGQIDPNIFNNFYSNNLDRTNTSIFTLSSNTLGGGTNFAVLNTSYTPKIKFSPGFYNIRIALYDPDGNLIIYDNTPTISSDSSFTGKTVPDKLMRLTLAMTLKPI